MFVQTLVNCMFCMSIVMGDVQKAFYCHRLRCKLGHRRWYNKSRGPGFAEEMKEGCMVPKAKHF